MSSGATGGAADEAGGQYRRALAAFFVAHALNGAEVAGLGPRGSDAVVETVALETDAPVDDILVGLRVGRVYVQAKRTLRMGRPFREVSEQWIRAVRDELFDPDRDYLAIVSGSISAPLQHAGRALQRRRLDATVSWSEAERRDVGAIRRVLADLGATEEEVSLILSRSVFLERKVEEEHDRDAENARLLLDGHVVSRGDGARAWRELVSAAGEAARLRIGHNVNGWLDQLRHAGVPLTEDAEASRAAQTERERIAVARYREQLQRRASRVDLTAIGARVPALEFELLDADVTVRDPDATDVHDRNDLLWALRRRGRVTLTGLPGGGKSLALRVLAGDWAARQDWAIPILVSLRRLAEPGRFRRRPLRDDLLDLAVEGCAAGDRAYVRDALDRALEEGTALILLDGLDEAADRRLDLASDIVELLLNVHPDNDVLVATRDVAYADAAILGFRPLALTRPRDPTKTVRAVLRAIGTQLGVDALDRWVAIREEWVTKTLQQDTQLSETPLLPLLLALLAGESDVEALPITRAAILEEVVRSIVERYEIRREFEFGALPGGSEATALTGAYPHIATALADHGGSAPRDALVEALKPYLAVEWDLAPGSASRTAEEILRFWDESGIFVAHGRDRITTARVQLFLEIGAALHAARGSAEDAPAFVARLAPASERHETLILAAGLSAPIADALITYAVAEDDTVLTYAAATALTQGGRANAEPLRALVLKMLRLISLGGAAGWRALNLLVDLPVPADLRGEIDVALAEAFDDGHVRVGRALTALAWGDWESRATALEAALQVRELSRFPRAESGSAFVVATVDQGFMRVKVAAARELLPGRPDLAQDVANAMEHASWPVLHELRQILRANGHGELASEAAQKLLPMETGRRVAQQMEDLVRDLRKTLDSIAALAAPTALTRQQMTRLDELANFVETLDLNNGSAWPRSGAIDGLRSAWYTLVAALGGFDLGVLASQAAIVRDDLARDQDERLTAFFSLFEGAEPAELKHWEAVDDIAGRDLAVTLLAGGWALARVAAAALVTHPDRSGTAAAVEARLPAVTQDGKRAAVWAILNLAPDPDEVVARFASSDDRGTREAIATLVRLTKDGVPTATGRVLALDAERTVQTAAIEQFGTEVESPSDELVELLNAIVESPTQPFVCTRCGTQNDADRSSCGSCNIVAEKPASVARKLLTTFGS